MDVVVAVLLDLQQERELGQALGGEGLQQRAVLLWGQFQKQITTTEHISQEFTVSDLQKIRYLQVFDGLLGDELLLFIPLNAAHDAGPHDADQCLFWNVRFLHLLTNVGNDLMMTNRCKLAD